MIARYKDESRAWCKTCSILAREGIRREHPRTWVVLRMMRAYQYSTSSGKPMPRKRNDGGDCFSSSSVDIIVTPLTRYTIVHQHKVYRLLRAEISSSAMLYASNLIRWLQRKRYQYEVTFSLYMLTPTEKFIFSTFRCPSFLQF